MDEPDRFAPGTLLAGKLRIVRLLGQGGMGAVYEVEHELTRHRRALKLLHAQMARIPSVVERFLREASAAGRIGNPHIVETFDAGRLDTGEPYIVMEMLRGRTLAEVLEQHGPLDLQTACKLLAQACDAVNAAHAAGIVHRDLKPENLFLCGPQQDFVKILDFGVSKFDSATTGVDGLTLEGSPIGTPFYMSPEQVRGEKSIDARADVYALGVLFYECLTGRKPFVAETLPHLAVLIYEGKCEPPSRLRQGITPVVDSVIAHAMANERAARFPTAAALGQAVVDLAVSHSTPPPAAGPAKAVVQPGVPGVTQESAGQRRAISALTPASFTSAQEPVVKKARNGGAIIAVATSLAVLGGLTIWFTRGERPAAVNSEQPVHPSSAPSAQNEPPAIHEPPAAEAPATMVAPSSAPATTAVTPGRVHASAPAHNSARAPATTAAAPAASASAHAKSAAPAHSSRAGQYGLSQDNPFK